MGFIWFVSWIIVIVRIKIVKSKIKYNDDRVGNI